jgi:hypothetical protein
LLRTLLGVLLPLHLPVLDAQPSRRFGTTQALPDPRSTPDPFPTVSGHRRRAIGPAQRQHRRAGRSSRPLRHDPPAHRPDLSGTGASRRRLPLCARVMSHSRRRRRAGCCDRFRARSAGARRGVQPLWRDRRDGELRRRRHPGGRGPGRGCPTERGGRRRRERLPAGAVTGNGGGWRSRREKSGSARGRGAAARSDRPARHRATTRLDPLSGSGPGARQSQ